MSSLINTEVKPFSATAFHNGKEVELTEDVEEVVHSPENSIESKRNLLSNPNKSMTTEQRVNRMLFN